MTTDQNQKNARHMRNTGAFPVGPLRDALLARGHVLPPPAPTNRHLVADGAKVQSWPLVDPQPTKALRRLTPKPEVQPEPEPARGSWLPKATMTRSDALTMQKACLWAAVLVAVFAVVAFVAVNVAGVS